MGHSFGGDIGNLLSEKSLGVTAFVSVEGNLTPHDLFISQRAVNAGSFTKWFGEFKEEIYQMGRESASFRRYFVNLNLADPDIFLESARSIVKNVGLLVPSFSIFGVQRDFSGGEKVSPVRHGTLSRDIISPTRASMPDIGS